jgi:hypothetical protein
MSYGGGMELFLVLEESQQKIRLWQDVSIISKFAKQLNIINKQMWCIHVKHKLHKRVSATATAE